MAYLLLTAIALSAIIAISLLNFQIFLITKKIMDLKPILDMIVGTYRKYVS